MSRNMTVAVCFWSLFCVASPVHAQLLFDDRDEDYMNYARTGYLPYTGGLWSEGRRPYFDELGNYVMRGIQVFHTEEGRQDAPNPGSLVDKDPTYTLNLSRLVVGHDSYGRWATRLIVGDRIRTKFTSLTLDMVALNGIRWDFALGDNYATLVSSRIDWPIFPSAVTRGRPLDSEADNEAHRYRRWATYLLGGHFERQVGALNMSFSYVNMHRTDSLVDWADNNIRGVNPSAINRPPAYIAVRVATAGEAPDAVARVYDMYIEGELQDIVPSITRHDADFVDQTYPNWDRYFPPGREIPPFVQFLRREFPLEQPGVQGYLEITDTEYLIYWFRIPQDKRDQIENVKFRALVSGDYLVSLSEVYLPISVESTSNPAVSGERATYYYKVAGARGRPEDQSNLGWISFVYGRQTGRNTGSIRVELDREGLMFRSEFARTYNHLQYPSPMGRNRWQTISANAFFVNVEKRLGPVYVGGEYFNMDPLYSTALSVEDQSYASYTDFLDSPFGIPHSFGEDRNYTVDLDSVDDNDAKDIWPDFHFLPHMQAPANAMPPGRDLRFDGRLDSNVNANRIPNYLEPFFLYYSDPPEFDYGDDWNNNGIIDHREADLNPDYPYDTDLKGYHLYMDLRPQRDLSIRIGHFDTEQIWGGGVNKAVYLQTDFERPIYPFGQIWLANTLKRVQDDIENPTTQLTDYVPNHIPMGVIQQGIVSASEIVMVEDELWMRDSVVNTAYLDATLFRIRNLRINNRLKSTTNFQLATDIQASNRIQEWAWVLRGDYSWYIGDFTISPKAKYMLYRKTDTNDQLHLVNERFFYPIVQVRYSLTDQSSIDFGIQGFPFLKSRFDDRTSPYASYKSQDYLISLTNFTTYSGQQLCLNMGYHRQILRFNDRRRAAQDIDRGLYFVRLILGMEPFKG